MYAFGSDAISTDYTQIQCPQFKKDVKKLKRVQRKVSEIMKKIGNMIYRKGSKIYLVYKEKAEV